ncbi:MAG: hypothetical protein ACRC2T_13180, partial [Thermoguttaceae bacterium]
MSMDSLLPKMSKLRIKQHLNCPHCWHEFPTDQLLFISESPDLLGDAKLGDVQQLRFLPLRFDLAGAALDSHGFVCHKLACPNCHFQIPRSILHTSNFFISIVGAPASGKSYFLTSMIWQLRKVMTRYFCMNFTDADAVMNKRIRDYESMLYMGDDNNRIVNIEKTEVSGDIYNTTQIAGKATILAQPFTFVISPMPNYPLTQNTKQISQTVCVYDNSGESFLPGRDSASEPVTRHLAKSDAILFLFDPTQDQRFQRACKHPISDPQMNSELG